MRNQNKKFVVKKYVWAQSAADAIKKESKVRVDDVWVDEDWRRANTQDQKTEIGFKK